MKEVWVLVLGFFMFLSAVCRGFPIIMPQRYNGREDRECL